MTVKICCDYCVRQYDVRIHVVLQSNEIVQELYNPGLFGQLMQC